MERVRYAVAFLIGAIVGSVALLLVLQVRGRLKPPNAPAADSVTAELPATGVSQASPARALVPSSLAIPVAGVDASDLRSDFGNPRSGGRSHAAIDIRAARGTPVIAAVDGTIRKIYSSAAGGLTIYQYDKTNQWLYYYAHLERYADGLREGQAVRRGQLIGYVGTSGNAAAAGPHLHFSIERLPPSLEYWKGSPVDPFPLLRDRGVMFAAPAGSAGQR
jgi:peptidoglycan LD-endopeptidase LytH